MVHRRLEQLLRRELYGGSARANKDGNQLFVAEDSFKSLVEMSLPWIGKLSKSQEERLRELSALWWKKFGAEYQKHKAESAENLEE